MMSRRVRVRDICLNVTVAGNGEPLVDEWPIEITHVDGAFDAVVLTDDVSGFSIAVAAWSALWPLALLI